MDNQDNQPQLTDEQQQALQEKLEAGVAFEELVRTKGYEQMKAYFQNKLQTFVTNLMNSDNPIQTFEGERQQLIGIKKLFGEVTNTLDTLEQERKRNEQSKTK